MNSFQKRIWTVSCDSFGIKLDSYLSQVRFSQGKKSSLSGHKLFVGLRQLDEKRYVLLFGCRKKSYGP